MRMSRSDWPDGVVETRQTAVCSVSRFERSKIDDNKTLHVFDELLACMSLYSCGELNVMQRTYTFV